MWESSHIAIRPAELNWHSTESNASAACVLSRMSVCYGVCMVAEERQSPELYASNVRKVMGDALGAELSSHGIPQQQALKRNGIYVDWTGR